MGLTLAHEVLRLRLRDPFRIARADHHSGEGVTTVVVELRDDRHPGIVGVGEGYPDRFYGETPDTMAAVFPVLLEAIPEPGSHGTGSRGLRVRPWSRRSGGTARQSARSTSRCTTLPARSSACPSTS